MVGLDRYGASVTAKLRVSLISTFFALALALVGFIVVVGIFTGEELCLDRHPWWGPPNDPNVYTSCSGHWYERHHKP